MSKFSKNEEIAFKRGYRVSEEGILYNPKGVEVGKHIANTGYKTIALKKNKINIQLSIHRLQAYQKYGKAIYIKGIVVRHLNGKCLDNSWENIAIGTASDNYMDIPKQIRIKRAVHASSFAQKHDHSEIVSYYKKHISYKKTMKKFNISSKGTLHYILNKTK